MRVSDSEQARLRAARVAGAGAVASLGQLAVNMPAGYFGSFDQLTPFGAIYAAAVLVAAAIGALAHLTAKRWAVPFELVLLSLNLAIFLPPLASDPVVAGGVVLWHLLLLGLLLFPVRPVRRLGPRGQAPALSPVDGWLARNRHAVQHLLAVALVLSVAVVGYRIGSSLPALLVCGLLDGVALVLFARFAWLATREGSRAPALLLLPLLAALASLAQPTAALGWLGVADAAALLMLAARSSVVADLIDFFFRRPALLLAASFAVLIALGTLLLSFPAAAAVGRSIRPVDALFTATSATCVTGLIVLDTPADFSTFGQSVILALIQVGGLNIMVLSAFAGVLLGRGLGLRGEKALGEVLDLPSARTATQLASFVVIATALIEGAGAVVLTPLFAAHGLAWRDALWRGVFHSVSAFCNAGFALQSDSLVPFRDDPVLLMVIATLIVLGGVGFAVLAAGAALGREGRSNLSVQVRIVLSVSAALIVLGAAWFLAVEWDRSLAGMSVAARVANAIFMAVTPRTAGFNSVDLTVIHPATALFIMALMFIGAAPGGTGGGIKVTTAAVLLGAIRAISRGEQRVVLFGRTVPVEVVNRSAAIAVIAGAVAFCATVALLISQGGELQALSFEVISALATVGLSLGATPTLTSFGKLVIVAVMFIGRIGPLALALLLGRATAARLIYPDARLMVG